MVPSSSKPVLLLACVAAALGLLVGLVRSTERSGPRGHSSSAEPDAGPREPVSSRVPLLPSAPATESSFESAGGSAAESTSLAATNERLEPTPEPRRARPRLTGRVLRPEGDPAGSARVVLGLQHARTDADGRFELVLDGEVSGADLIAYEPGYAPTLRPAFGATLPNGSDQSVQLVLGPETSNLAGRVTTPEGVPLKGWTVELDGPDPLLDFGLRESVRTDAEGRFLVADVPHGFHVVRAFAAPGAAVFRSAPFATGEEGLVLAGE
jgi:hypothetical protein